MDHDDWDGHHWAAQPPDGHDGDPLAHDPVPSDWGQHDLGHHLPDQPYDHPDADLAAHDAGGSYRAAFDAAYEAHAHHPDLGYADDTAGATPLPDTDPFTEPAWHHDGGLGVPIGTDPDVDPGVHDGTWAQPPFPAALNLADRPDPMDGYPWTDATLLGADPTGAHPPGGPAMTADPYRTDLNGTDLYGTDPAGGPHPSGADDAGGLDGAEGPDRLQPVARDLAAYDLAAYDATALPAGADAWGLLRDSADPATSALARWWGSS